MSQISHGDDFALRRLVDLRTTATHLGVSTKTLRRMIARKEMPPTIRVGERKLYFRVGDLARWQDERQGAA